MDFTRLRALNSLFSLLNQGVRNVIAYNRNHCDFPMQVRFSHMKNEHLDIKNYFVYK